MSGITQCPHCNTRFRIHQEQLEARRGLVCCGRCQHAFNARAHMLPEGNVATTTPVAEPPPAPQPTPIPPLAIDRAPPLTTPPTVTATPPHEPAVTESEPFADEASPTLLAPPAKLSAIHWFAAMSIALTLLSAQTAYFFRAEISSHIPALAPAIQTYCQLVGCSVQLPRQAELLVLESSGLESPSGNPAQVTLTALVRNSANYTQDFPHLQLSLTNQQSAAIARRRFQPADYLERTGKNAVGMTAGQKLEIRIQLDIAELKPDGYNLLLFYPPR